MISVGVGAVLTAFALVNIALAISIMVATAGVAVAARRIGRVTGKRIAGRHAGAALIAGAVGGFGCLLVSAVLAALIGAMWSLWDSQPLITSNTAWSYLGKPFFGVLMGGIWLALPLGAAGGLVIRALQRRSE
jgi:hypothetical protein